MNTLNSYGILTQDQERPEERNQPFVFGFGKGMVEKQNARALQQKQQLERVQASL